MKFNEKYYVTGHGFCEAKAKGNIDNIGRVMENIVYFELLRRGWNITIGKTKDYEVDFVFRKHNEKIYVQVSYLLESEKKKQLKENSDHFLKLKTIIQNIS